MVVGMVGSNSTNPILVKGISIREGISRITTIIVMIKNIMTMAITGVMIRITIATTTIILIIQMFITTLLMSMDILDVMTVIMTNTATS